ncbi:hypothetical protein F444_00937, partial [Phytophthora nicotianae P1976]
FYGDRGDDGASVCVSDVSTGGSLGTDSSSHSVRDGSTIQNLDGWDAKAVSATTLQCGEF